MQKEFYYDKNPECKIWDEIWETRTVEQELEACEIETPPRELFLKYLSKKDKIVDAGCGFGKWVNYLHRRGYNIVGIDNNEFAISKLKEFDGTLQVKMGDILNIDYPDNRFGAYISMGVIEHFEEGPQAPLKEAYRVLCPGGLIFVSVPTVNMIRKFIRPSARFVVIILKALKTTINRGNSSKWSAFKDTISKILPANLQKKSAEKNNRYYHFLEYRYTVKELKDILNKNGFEMLKTIPHDFYGSKEHAIGLWMDLPFLRQSHKGVDFKMNLAGKVVSRILDNISPWIACASVICVARSTKKV